MRLILDTHALLWFLLNDPQLSEPALHAIADPNNDIFVSPASYWELAIKIQLGKYSLPERLGQFMEREIAINELEVIPILPAHADVLTTLPTFHRDPFDRLIIAQAMCENLIVVTCDAVFAAYPVQQLW